MCVGGIVQMLDAVVYILDNKGRAFAAQPVENNTFGAGGIVVG